MSAEPFAFFRKNTDHDKFIVEKSDRLYLTQLLKIDENTVQFDSYDSYGRLYSRFIYINAYFFNCKRFWDKSYCHHILAIIRLGIANIILDPKYIPEPPKRR